MKTIEIDNLTLALEDFLRQEAPTPDDICKTLAALFDLYLTLIFRPTEHCKTTKFSRAGFYYKQKSKIPAQEFSLLDLPEQRQKFWKIDKCTDAIHGTNQKETIKHLAEKLNVPGINQFGLMKFGWGGDKRKTYFLIVGVETELETHSTNPFFTCHNLKPIRDLAQILTSHLETRICVEFRKRIGNFEQIRVRGSRTALKMAAEEIVADGKLKKQLEICTDRTVSAMKEDYIWSTYLDMKTALNIIPGQDAGNHKDVDLLAPNKDEYPLTKLALIRTSCLERAKKPQYASKDEQSVRKI